MVNCLQGVWGGFSSLVVLFILSVVVGGTKFFLGWFSSSIDLVFICWQFSFVSRTCMFGVSEFGWVVVSTLGSGSW